MKGGGLSGAGSCADAARTAFVLANTELLAPPLVPEIKLHLAAQSLPIWEKTEAELGAVNVPPPYWAFAWPGGQALARYILDHPAFAIGRRVLDLGAGCGLGAIAATKVGAAAVLANDIDALALAAMRLNAEENGVAFETTAADLLEEGLRGFDVVLVGDLFYERQLAARVLACIEATVKQGATVLAADPRRNYFAQERFAPAARYDVPVTLDLEDALVKPTTVWRLAANP